jgi:radical SAM protein with 4Fe4S-binding SPASM domain
MSLPEYSRDDFSHSPLLVFYEITQQSDLVGPECQGAPRPSDGGAELTPEQSLNLIRQIATFPRPPLLVLTGADPMKRPDVYEIVGEASKLKLKSALTLAASNLVNREVMQRLKDVGLGRVAIGIDGANAATHDGIRGVDGSFDKSLRMLEDARQLGLPAQVNTTICRRNANQVDEMADMLARYGIVLWSVFFLVPADKRSERRVSPRQYERVFERLWRQSRHQQFGIKTTEAPQYRRFVLQRAGDPQRGGVPGGRGARRAPLGVNDGRGVMFVSSAGQVFPSGFLPIECGKFPKDSVIETYQSAPLFQALRDPNKLQGKCQVCEYRQICGGSRARAFAVTGDPLAQEPDCVYSPANWHHAVALQST